jgi:hypothetical protein
MQTQQQQEVISIVNDWADKHAPKHLSQTDHNASLIADFIVKKCGGFFSFSNLSRAVAELGDLASGGSLQFHSLPRTPKEIAREKRDFLAKMGIITNSASWKADSAELTRKTEANINSRKQVAVDLVNSKAKREVMAEIERYSAQHSSGRKDHSETDRRRARLRQLLPKDEKADWTAVLERVKAEIKRYPN